jgi:hypothetical protein
MKGYRRVAVGLMSVQGDVYIHENSEGEGLQEYEQCRE